MSKLTFIVPVYKPDQKHFERCLKSLTEQSLTDWEAVFVLDGPNEDAAKTIQRAMKKKPNHYRIIEQEHGGACKARNTGFAASKTPYVVFWDCDSAIEPHAAKAWVDILDKQPGIGFVYSGYKFSDEKGAINSEPFDPWLLRVTNYISTCFPVRRELVGEWDESLESLQDWDFWLGVVSRGGVGMFLQGYAFSTAYPTPESISGKGCTPEKWLERMDKVKAKHKIPQRDVCLTSIEAKHDAIALAKLMDADYMDRPNDKPNHYKTIIQVGFSLNPQIAETHALAWGPIHKKVLFWTRENVDEIYNSISLHALEEYSSRLNAAAIQFVEDKAAQRIMERAGFQVKVLPLPLVNNDETAPMPKRPKFLVDAAGQYGAVLAVVKKALPDMDIEIARGFQKIEDCTGLLHFYIERAMSGSAKRMILAGRHVVSNIQSPFCGFLEDKTTDEKFIVEVVERLRAIAKQGPNEKGKDYYRKALSVEKLKEAIA
jgi:glycosyltransferase involved in cell wall biosynthesis